MIDSDNVETRYSLRSMT